jgi:creatinine amidohydrolase
MYDATSPEVHERLVRVPIAVVPFGSVEQHGPHLPCGTDSMAADLVARRLADRLDALHVPFAPYGVTPIHAGHPGTVSLRKETFEVLVRDVCNEMVEMGAKTLILVNWHEVNTSSLDAVAIELQSERDARVFVAHACYVAQRIYAERGGELTHGGGIETLAVMAHDPSLLRLDAAGEPTRPPGADAADAMRRSHEVYGFITDVTEIAEDGWYGNPRWASQDLADRFADEVASEIEERLRAIGALEGSR